MPRVLNTDNCNAFHRNCVHRGLLNSLGRPCFLQQSHPLPRSPAFGAPGPLGPWPPAATWSGLSEYESPSSSPSLLQIIQEPSPSRPGPHQAPGPRPEGNAIAMETAPAPSVAPFSGPAPRALQGRAPACSSFASPGEPRARASERESGYACALGTSPSGDPGRCRSLGQDAGRAGGGGSGFAGSPE